ncbi:olfactory receptor 51I2-like [Tachyglossus aculeatus]|uniref:olfactory receptor 51I2-like n=1 Tax=Tachyglossus aculeatus TaxID=9261 RepID=UPI0018F77F1D|nr:olfactory receptor 51I2-like [Tachyglossus aculeatus]
MGDFHSNASGSLSFILTGFPGLEDSLYWMFILLGALYSVAILGNSLILVILKEEQSLHQPMYYFLAMLSISDLGVSCSTLPTVLGTFCFNIREVGFDACMAQMFFIHFFSLTESGILLAMSFDRYVAICNPLRYSAILIGSCIVKMGLAVLVRSFILILPLPFFLRRLPFCKANILHHAYCLHPDLIRLPCGDTTVNSLFGLSILVSTFGLDSVLIFISYVLIFRSVLTIVSQAGRSKAFNTCVSHICAVLIFYIPIGGVSMSHRYGKLAPPFVHTLMSIIYLSVPPMLNPIIYSIKTKEIHKRMVKMLSGAFGVCWGRMFSLNHLYVASTNHLNKYMAHFPLTFFHMQGILLYSPVRSNITLAGIITWELFKSIPHILCNSQLCPNATGVALQGSESVRDALAVIYSFKNLITSLMENFHSRTQTKCQWINNSFQMPNSTVLCINPISFEHPYRSALFEKFIIFLLLQKLLEMI